MDTITAFLSFSNYYRQIQIVLREIIHTFVVICRGSFCDILANPPKCMTDSQRKVGNATTREATGRNYDYSSAKKFIQWDYIRKKTLHSEPSGD